MKLAISPTGILKALFLLANLICVLNVFQFSIVLSVLYVCIFPLVVLLFVLTLSKGRYKNDIVLLLIIAISSLVSVLISVLISNDSFEITEIKKFIIFIVTLVLFIAVNRLKVDKKTIRFIEISVSCASVALVLLYFIKYNELYIYNLLGMKFLYFHFDNPNFAAMHFLVYAIYNSILAQKQNKIYLKLFHIALALFMSYFVFQTLSRNALLTFLVFFVIFIVMLFIKRPKRSFGMASSTFIAAWPIIFVAAYKLLLFIISKLGIFSFLTESGKELDTRNIVWNDVIAEILEYPLTGNYGASVIRQSHNTHLDIWVSYGIIALIGTIILIAYIIYNNGRAYKNNISNLYMLGFICCIIMGMAEAALFAGCQGLFILVAGFVLLSKTDNENSLKET